MNESQIIQNNQELQLATEEGSVQSHPTSIRSNTYGSIRISLEPSNDQPLNNQNECTPPRLESMKTMSGLPTTNTFAFYPGEDELIQFDEGFYNTDISNLEISNIVSDDSVGRIGPTCQTRLQVKSRKESSRTNSINYISRITNRFAINETSCSQRKEEKCYQRNKITTDASESGTGATLKKGNKVIKTWSFQWSSTQ
ncbi:hypothetical protein ACTFIZ_012882 [Dictyostelium cf. discoideum]